MSGLGAQCGVDVGSWAWAASGPSLRPSHLCFFACTWKAHSSPKQHLLEEQSPVSLLRRKEAISGCRESDEVSARQRVAWGGQEAGGAERDRSTGLAERDRSTGLTSNRRLQPLYSHRDTGWGRSSGRSSSATPPPASLWLMEPTGITPAHTPTSAPLSSPIGHHGLAGTGHSRAEARRPGGGRCADEVSGNVGWGQGDGREGVRGSWSGRERGVIDAEFSWTGARACC